MGPSQHRHSLPPQPVCAQINIGPYHNDSVCGDTYAVPIIVVASETDTGSFCCVRSTADSNNNQPARPSNCRICFETFVFSWCTPCWLFYLKRQASTSTCYWILLLQWWGFNNIEYTGEIRRTRCFLPIIAVGSASAVIIVNDGAVETLVHPFDQLHVYALKTLPILQVLQTRPLKYTRSGDTITDKTEWGGALQHEAKH
jgi:hypothetical protein